MKIVHTPAVAEKATFVSDFDHTKPAHSQLEIESGYGSTEYDGMKFVFDLSDEDVRKVLDFIKLNLADKDLSKYIKEDIFGNNL